MRRVPLSIWPALLLASVALWPHPAAAQDAREDAIRGFAEALGVDLYASTSAERFWNGPWGRLDSGQCDGGLTPAVPTGSRPPHRADYPIVLRVEHPCSAEPFTPQPSWD